MAIEDLLKKYRDVKGKQNKINVSIDENEQKNIKELLGICEDWLNIYVIKWWSKSTSTWINWLNEKIVKYDISSKYIQEFCLRLNGLKEHNRFHSVGLFISAMIQKAHKSGETEFNVPIRHLNRSVGYISSDIYGTKGGPNIKIDGYAGFYCGQHMHNVKLIFNGKTGSYCACRVNDCEIIFNGRAGCDSGQYSTNSTFIFNSYIGKDCCLDAKDCKIYSPIEENLSVIEKNVHASSELFLIDRDEVEPWH